MTKIAVIMGGRSYEREVSLVTGKQVADALLSRGYEVVCLDITDSLYNDLLNEKPDCVYIALHGSLGEDGCVQGLLEILELPYVGSGVLASALGMNKAMAKEIFRSTPFPLPAAFYWKEARRCQPTWLKNLPSACCQGKLPRICRWYCDCPP